jgi:hypothetical protein
VVTRARLPPQKCAQQAQKGTPQFAAGEIGRGVPPVTRARLPPQKCAQQAQKGTPQFAAGEIGRGVPPVTRARLPPQKCAQRRGACCLMTQVPKDPCCLT